MKILYVFPLLAAVMPTVCLRTATGQGPVPIELIKNGPKPGCLNLTLASIHAADGEPLAIRAPDREVHDARQCDLSVDQAMARLSELAGDALPFHTPEEAEARCDEFDCLSAIVARDDVGALARIKALDRLMRAYGAMGREPLELGRWRPIPMSPFRAGPGLARHLTWYHLSEESTRFFEAAFKSEFERITDIPEPGPVAGQNSSGGSPAVGEDYVTLLKMVLDSGYASRSFAARARDRFLHDLETQLFETEVRSILSFKDLKLIAAAGALEPDDMAPLLDVAGSALLRSPDDRRYNVTWLVSELVLLPGFQEQHAVRLLSLLDAAVKVDPSWARRAGSIIKPVLGRFDMQTLYPDDSPPEVVASHRRGARRYRSQDKYTVYSRISSVRFSPDEEPVVLNARSQVIDSAYWTVFRHGNEESAGLVAINRVGDKIDWSFNYGATEMHGSVSCLVPNNLALQKLLTFRVYSQLWDDWRNLPRATTFDCQFLELRSGPFERDTPSSTEIFGLLAATVPEESLLMIPVFNWMKTNSHPLIRQTLVALATHEDKNQNLTSVRAADLLAQQEDYLALSELIPDLLELRRCSPTPAMAAFYSLADDKRVPSAIKRAWAAEMIRQHLNGPLGEWGATSVMKVAIRLSGESFGFDRDRSGEENRGAFHEAQTWAWRQPSTDP